VGSISKSGKKVQRLTRCAGCEIRNNRHNAGLKFSRRFAKISESIQRAYFPVVMCSQLFLVVGAGAIAATASGHYY